MSVVGDNIANVNTDGFKRQRSVFEDVLGRSALGGNDQPGAGVRFEGVQLDFTQGALLNTGVATDVALTGDGFFTLSGSVNGVTGLFFSRSGQFSLNSSGELVNPQGLAVVGYPVDRNGVVAASTAPLSVPPGGIPARATSAMDLTANLDSTATAPTAAWDPQNPATTSNFSTGLTVYDSLGAPHPLELCFRKVSAGRWECHVLANGAELNPTQPGLNVEVGTGALGFATNGALDTVTAPAVAINFLNATPGQAIAVSFGTPIAAGGSGLDGVTQFAASSGVSALSQNGGAAGALSGLAIRGDGSVVGQYTNGETLAIGKLAIAKFRANDGLARAGAGLFVDTLESGAPAFGMAASGGRGAVSSGALEAANVDLAQEMVDMIQHQRAFSANSKTISTADEMLTALMNIKR